MKLEHAQLKTKDIIELVVAVVILAFAAYLLYTILAPHTAKTTASAKTVTYVKVTPVNPDFSQTELSQLDDGGKVRDFYSPPDLTSGLNNTQPFGPLQ